MLPCISGLSWLPLLSTTRVFCGVTLSQAQPLPKRVSAALVKASLKASKPPSWASMVCARAPCGSPPPCGDITVQNRLWLACPPPWLVTAPRRFSGSCPTAPSSFSTGHSAHSVPSMAALRPLT
ncbi:hypothetical protein D3C78_1314260 [compost metagenome]